MIYDYMYEGEFLIEQLLKTLQLNKMKERIPLNVVVEVLKNEHFKKQCNNTWNKEGIQVVFTNEINAEVELDIDAEKHRILNISLVLQGMEFSLSDRKKEEYLAQLKRRIQLCTKLGKVLELGSREVIIEVPCKIRIE